MSNCGCKEIKRYDCVSKCNDDPSVVNVGVLEPVTWDSADTLLGLDAEKKPVRIQKPDFTEDVYTREETDELIAQKPDASDIDAAIDTVNERIDGIDELIPSTATPENKLADQAFVNSSIEATAARPLTYDATGNPFPTKASLTGATTFYNKGVAVTPTENDYVVVQADETQAGGQVRYGYDGTTWVFRYKINDAPFTESQNAAINSGITEEMIEEFKEYPEQISKGDEETLEEAKDYTDEKVLDITQDINRFVTPQKTYATLSAMRADLAPVADDGQAFDKGWMANIVTNPSGSANDQEFYYYEATGAASTNWKYGGKAGATQDLSPYALHGYSSDETPKTVKGVEKMVRTTLPETTKRNNMLSCVYDNFDQYTINNNADGVATKEMIPFNQHGYNFTKAIKMGYEGTFANAINFYINADVKFSPKISLAFLMLVKQEVGGNNINYIRLQTHRGYPDLSVQLITIGFQTSAVNTIITAIKNNGYYENNVTKGIFRITAYFAYNEGYMFECHYINTEDLLPADSMRVQIGISSSANQPGRFVYFAGLHLFADNKEIDLSTASDEYLYDYNKDAEYYISMPKLHYASNNEKYNIITPYFEGGGNVVKANNTSQIAAGNDGFFIKLNGSKIEKVEDDILGIGYKFSMEDDSALPKYNTTDFSNLLFLFSKGEKIPATSFGTFMFWINIDELNGNGILQASTQAGYIALFLNNSEIMGEGIVETRQQYSDPSTPVIKGMEVVKVFGRFACIKVYNRPSNDITISKVLGIGLYDNTGGGDIFSFTFYNPVLLYDNENIDPFRMYLSESEKNNSKWIGKNALLVGDSQYNNGYAVNQISKKLGVRVIDAHYGGNSIKYRNVNYANWLYSTDKKDVAVGNGADIYILTMSTNDGSGGGTLDEASINAVLANYPVYGDDETVAAEKMELFNAMSEADRVTTFGYLQTYAAYIKQILARNPETIIVICSLPIACSSRLTGDTDENGNGVWNSDQSPDIARAALYSGSQQIRQNTKDIADYFGLKWCDLYSLVGLTYENFTSYCIDSTHWNGYIGTRIGTEIVKILN